MIVVVDERQSVKDQYISLFGSEGIPSAGFAPAEFSEWVNTAAAGDIEAVEAFLIGQSGSSLDLPKAIRERSMAPVIAMSDTTSLESNLAFFDSGVDDVVRRPVHPREILARAAAIRRRLKHIINYTDFGPLRVFSDGRDPEIQGETFKLPHLERRLVEYLVANRDRRVSRTQIFNAIYGIFDEDVDEEAVSKHLSSLRKKLKLIFGYDPILSDRQLGYRIEFEPAQPSSREESQSVGSVRARAMLTNNERIQLSDAVRAENPTRFPEWDQVKALIPDVEFVATEIDGSSFDLLDDRHFVGRACLLLTSPYRLFGEKASCSMLLAADVTGSIGDTGDVQVTDFTFRFGETDMISHHVIASVEKPGQGLPTYETAALQVPHQAGRQN